MGEDWGERYHRGDPGDETHADRMFHWMSIHTSKGMVQVKMHSHAGTDCFDPACRIYQEEAKAKMMRNEPVPARQRVEKQLRYVWDTLNADEANKVVPKAIEYGSGDLKLMGYALKQLLNSPRARQRDWTEAESMEMACVFYTLGKVARMLSAYEMGNMPSEDQPHDVGVYMRMVQILRKTGAWPPGFEDYLKETE